MKHFKASDLDQLASRFRANLINSCTGYKSINLISTQDKKGNKNLAIFNSIIHLGSNPALIGFTFRPLTVQRDTYNNIKETGVFTVNHVHYSFTDKAHQTAAKYHTNTSEFEAVGLSAEYKEGSTAPFVAESTIKYSCEYVNEYPIKENGCIMMVAAIQSLYVDESYIEEDGWIDLSKAETATGIGLDGYTKGIGPIRFEYAQVELAPKRKSHA